MKFVIMILLSVGMLWAEEKDAYSQGSELYKSGDYAKSIPFLEEAVLERPSWFAPYMLQGQAYVRLAQYDKALLQLKEALSMEVPEEFDVGIRYYIGRAHMGLREYLNAAKIFDEISGRAPAEHQPGIFMNAASCYMALAKGHMDGDSQKAVVHFRQSSYNFGKAVALENTQLRDRRTAAFQKSWAMYQIGRLEKQPEQYGAGARFLADYLKDDPQDQRSYRFLIDLDFLQIRSGHKVDENYRIALTHLAGYLEQWPGDPRMIHFKGQAYLGLNAYDQAVPHLRQAVSKEPTNGKYLYSLGSALMATKDFSEAIEVLQKAGRNGEEANANVYFYQSACYAKQKTGCFTDDKPLIKAAIKVLEEGREKVKASARGNIDKALDLNRQNLAVFEENLRTDKENHRTVLSNIQGLESAIKGNTDKLIIAKDRNLQLSTPELLANIKELETRIAADKRALVKESTLLKEYIADANTCGAASFPLLKMMKETAARL